MRARSRVSLASFVAATALAAGCSLLQTVGATYNSFMAKTKNVADPPSHFYCGNQLKDNVHVPPPPQVGNCASRATWENGNIPAKEVVEVRGWLLSAPQGCDPVEICFTMSLDYGWTQQTDSTTHLALNTPEKIVYNLTPHDIIMFAQQPLIDPVDELYAFGGDRSGVIHVEANGWAETAIHTDNSNITNMGPAPADWTLQLPGPWTPAADKWPFNVYSPDTFPAGNDRNLSPQDYVRVVGTLWEDDWHPSSPHDNESRTPDLAEMARDAKECWHTPPYDRGASGRGWKEIHPVDWMAKLPPPARDRRNDKLWIVALCGVGEVTFDVIVGVPPTGQFVDYQEIVNNDFTVGSVVLDAKEVTVLPDGIRVHIALKDLGSGHSKYFVGYHVYWTR